MKIESQHLLYGGIAALVLLVAGYAYLFTETRKLSATAEDLASTTSKVAESLALLEQKSLENADIVYAAQQDVERIQKRIGGFEDTLGTLEKLSKTDPELLQKYSKVFFLNEHYAPERLAQIDSEYTYSEARPERIHASVWPHLEELLEDANDDGIELFVKSSYRSFDEQSALKGIYTVTYGAGSANRFSADQGYSEHQLGTTVDFISTGQGGVLAGFEKTEAYDWLLENAHEYGFVLSYPEGNNFYIFEPWHWRFVGTDLAGDLHRDNEHFYDLEQREIDEYLAEIFD